MVSKYLEQSLKTRLNPSYSVTSKQQMCTSLLRNFTLVVFSYWSRNNSIELYPAQLFDNFAQKWTLAKSHIDSSHPWTFLRVHIVVSFQKLFWWNFVKIQGSLANVISSVWVEPKWLKKKDLYNLSVFQLVYSFFFILKNTTSDARCTVVYYFDFHCIRC